MKITPINNNQGSFRAQFIKTPALEKVIEAASDYDLMKFGKVLKTMSKKEDGIKYNFYSAADRYTSVYLRRSKTLDNGRGFFHDYRLSSNEFPSTAYKNVLNKANKILEESYPEEEITNVKREASLRIIEKELSTEN